VELGGAAIGLTRLDPDWADLISKELGVGPSLSKGLSQNLFQISLACDCDALIMKGSFLPGASGAPKLLGGGDGEAKVPHHVAKPGLCAEFN